MNPCVVSRAVLTRIQADTGTGGLYSASGGTAYYIIKSANFNAAPGSPPIATPYLVWDIQMDDDHDMNGMEAAYTLTFFCNDDSATANDNLEIVVDRLTGDAMLSTGTRTNPTYGFHNHRLVLPSNTLTATASDMTRVSARVGQDDPNYLTATVVFKGRTSVQAVNQ